MCTSVNIRKYHVWIIISPACNLLSETVSKTKIQDVGSKHHCASLSSTSRQQLLTRSQWLEVRTKGSLPIINLLLCDASETFSLVLWKISLIKIGLKQIKISFNGGHIVIILSPLTKHLILQSDQHWQCECWTTTYMSPYSWFELPVAMHWRFCVIHSSFMFNVAHPKTVSCLWLRMVNM